MFHVPIQRPGLFTKRGIRAILLGEGEAESRTIPVHHPNGTRGDSPPGRPTLVGQIFKWFHTSSCLKTLCIMASTNNVALVVR
jgi:hypothetical protein